MAESFGLIEESSSMDERHKSEQSIKNSSFSHSLWGKAEGQNTGPVTIIGLIITVLIMMITALISSGSLIASTPAYHKWSIPFVKAPAQHKPTKIGKNNTHLSCPVWDVVDPDAMRNWDFSNNCHSLSDHIIKSSETGNEFDIDLCLSPVTCGEGYVSIKRKNQEACQSALATEFTWSHKTRSFITDRFGPDSFVLFLDAPGQVFGTVEAIHKTNCQYNIPFRLVNPTGVVNLTLIHSFSNYEAFFEKTISTDQLVLLNNQYLFNKTAIDLNCPQCPTYSPKSVADLSLNSNSPLCPRNSSVPGVFLRMTFETEREHYKYINNQRIPYIWQPLACRYDQLWELNSNDTCLSDISRANVGLTGDSLMRYFFIALDNRVGGFKGKQLDRKAFFLKNAYRSGNEKAPLQKDLSLRLEKAKQEAREQGKPIPNEYDLPWDHIEHFPKFDGDEDKKQMYLSFLWDPYLDRLTGYYKDFPEKDDSMNSADKDYKDFDTVIFEMGHWPMFMRNYGHMWTMEEGRARLTANLEVLRAINFKFTKDLKLKEAPMRFIWQGIHATPPQVTDKWIHWSVRKNPHRTLMWNLMAKDVFESVFRDQDSLGIQGLEREGMPVFEMIDAFALSIPWIRHSPDGGHFHQTPATDALVDETLHRLDFCRAG